jgi:class 3 adenylate cyclase
LVEKILTSKAALEGERKQVTVLFADLKGSMELLADCDPEDARQLLDPVLECMMEAVHCYEGTVNQVMGDGIMALFGTPIAHEDHAVRACYAALRMQEAVKRYAAEVQRIQGVPLHIRVGVNSGEVVVRSIGSDLHMDYTAVGQTTHLAARMEQMAMPGTTLISAHTLRLVDGYAQVKPLGPVAVKGLTDAVAVCELVGAAPVRTSLQTLAARELTRFVGREDELDQLRQALQRVQAGHGQLVSVIGEPGVGKTRRLSLAYALSGRMAEAQTLLAQGIEQLPAWDLGGYWSPGSLLGETYLLVGQIDKALAQATRALDFAASYEQRAYQGWALRLLGEIAMQRDPPERMQVADYYRQALALADELGMRPLQAHCHRGLGQLYAKIGRVEQAHTELSIAIELYRAMEMTFWLPQTEAALAQVEGR